MGMQKRSGPAVQVASTARCGNMHCDRPVTLASLQPGSWLLQLDDVLNAHYKLNSIKHGQLPSSSGCSSLILTACSG